MKKKVIKRLLWTLGIIFLLMNLVAFMHAYKLTHFSTAIAGKTKEKLTTVDKLKLLFTGVNNPRPVNKVRPQQPYQKVCIKSNKTLEGWLIQKQDDRGTVILFHGYGGEKSSMLDKAYIFLDQGYNVLLVDFMGSGGSEGHQTTIGYKEAEQVKDCFHYLKERGYPNIVLFGTSMGAVAILKAVHDYKISPASIIIECPFGTMYQTVCARFKMQKVPTFPMAGLLLFWGGVQNVFWAFSHNPVDYAKEVSCPTLLMYGGSDSKVSREEIDRIYKNLKGIKTLRVYPQVGHENYLRKYLKEWTSDIETFLKNNDSSLKIAPECVNVNL